MEGSRSCRLRALMLAGLALLGIAVAGCGNTNPGVPSPVKLSLVAPTDGATVGVRGITVLGTVAPQDAVVLVAGRRAHVHKGVFRLPLGLRRRLTRIRIVARAPGYANTTVRIAVRYNARAASAGPQRTGFAGSAANDFFSRAEQVCAANISAIESLPPAATLPQLLNRADRILALGSGLAHRLASISAPPDLAPAYGAFVAAFQSRVQAAASLMAEIHRGDLQAAADQAQKEEQLVSGTDLSGAALDLGIPACARGPASQS